jgi:glycosyltransferase involved in cell wall biosynthesis
VRVSVCIEAARHGLPIMARDIPVFREVAGEHAFYFAAEKPDLAQAIKDWLRLYRPASIQSPTPSRKRRGRIARSA